MRNRYLTQLGVVVLAVVAVSAISVWDTEEQSRHAVARLALSQGTLARALALDLDSRVLAEERYGRDPNAALANATRELLDDAATLGPPRETLIFVTVGQRIQGLDNPVSALRQLLITRGDSLELSRDDAHALGLPRRRAVAVWRASNREGLGVMLVATAELERVHAEREQFVSVVSIIAISLIVLGLGVLAIRRDAEGLRLAHELERRRLEHERDEQLARAERIAVASALSLGIAHELATPLGVIALRVEGLKRNADEKARASLAVITEQVAQMKQVMQGFLALARGDAPVTTESNPVTLAQTAAQFVAHRFEAAGVTFELEASAPLPTVRADETLLRQALTNLLINAAQASRSGGRVVMRLAKQDGMLAWHVVDEGEGIAADVASQVTRPFVTTRAHAGGTGLGLAITQEIARHHGGALTLSPAPNGHGTEATLRLPLPPENA
ncbi:MAG: sensor histidine kinase [Archangium sp.]